MEEQPEPPESNLPVPSEGELAPVEEGEFVEADGQEIPAELSPKGLRGFLRGRISVKIVAPFIIVMFILAVGGTFVVLNLVTTSLAQRFQNQLLDAGKGVNDTIVKVESSQLELLRLMTNTEGVDTALVAGDPVALQKLLLPLQANSTFNYVDVVDTQGNEVLALRPDDPNLKGQDPNIATWDVTQKSIAGASDQFGNKWTELVSTSFGPMVYTGGPVTDTDNQVVGAVLVGIPFNDLLTQLSKDVVASVTVYTRDGDVFDTSLKLGDNDRPLTLDAATLDQIFGDNQQTVQRQIAANNVGYMELLGGLVLRDKVAGGLGVALPTGSIEKASQETQKQFIIIFMTVTMVVLVIGLTVARRISKPIQMLVKACQMVARGDLEQEVNVSTHDETGVLAFSFNRMVDGLRERDRIRDTFGRYMTQQVSDAILKGDVELGGEMRELTMFMSDIRSFTTLSETMKPGDLVAFLNRYFSAMIDCVMAHDGIVDKFMGDAILVVYGAPVRDLQHPMKAVLTALDMRARMVSFNEELVAEGHAPIRIGIGINTGEAITGNIGSEVRMEYTVIGDAVNATQRTEDLTKDFKTDILISDRTAAELDGRFILGEPHHITLRGRTQESLIYPVLGMREGDEEAWRDQGPLIVGAAVKSAQDVADTTVKAAEEGRLEEAAEEVALTLVKSSATPAPTPEPEANGADKPSTTKEPATSRRKKS